jgi:hypothetical protein
MTDGLSNGASPRRKLTSNAERAERDRRIAEARLAGRRWSDICAEHGVSESTARRAARALAPTLRPIAEEQVRSYRDVDVEMIVSLGVEAVAVALDKGLTQLKAEDEPDPKLMSAVSRLFTSATTNMIRIGLLADAGDEYLLRKVEDAHRQMASYLYEAAGEAGIPLEHVDRVLDGDAARRRALDAAQKAPAVAPMEPVG